MKSHIGRLYSVAGAMMVLFLGWAAIAAHPWDAPPVDPVVAALTERRAQVRDDAAEAKKIVTARWSTYEKRLAVRKRAINRAWQLRKKEEAVYQQRMAAAQARRPVIVRTVYVQTGPVGPAPAAPASAPISGGGYSAAAPAASSGSPSGAASAPVYSAPAASSAPASAPVSAPAAVSAPPIVSVGAWAHPAERRDSATPLPRDGYRCGVARRERLRRESGNALEAAEREIRRLEGLLSRFLPDSELSYLNRAGSIVAGPELAEVVDLALAGRERTGGRFDPTVHDAVVAAGYDRSFDLIDLESAAGDPTVAPRCGGVVHLDRVGGVISLDPGVTSTSAALPRATAPTR